MNPQDLQSLEPDTPIQLIEVSRYRLSDPTETIRICNHLNVSYRLTPTAQPFEYLPIGLEVGGYEISAQGALPQPTITISNIGRMLDDWMNGILSDPGYVIEGALVVRRITQIGCLEGGPNYLSPLRELEADEFEVEQVADRTTTYIKLLLSSAIDLEGEHSGRIALRTCPFTLGDPDTCNYQGPNMFTRENQPTTNPNLNVCPGNVAACELRFPPPMALRHGGYPGLGGL